MVGLLGRKSGQGFYSYADGVPKPATPAYIPAVLPTCRTLVVMGSGALADRLAHSLHEAGRTYTRNTGADWVGLSVDGAHLRQTDGRAATLLTNPDTVVFDWPLSTETGAVLAVAPSLRASDAWVKQAHVWVRALGWTPVPDGRCPRPGGGAHGGDADQRSGRCGAPGRVHCRWSGCGHEAWRQLSSWGRSSGWAKWVHPRWRSCWTHWTLITGANATVSARGCACV
jgi:hypothetical protein